MISRTPSGVLEIFPLGSLYFCLSRHSMKSGGLRSFWIWNNRPTDNDEVAQDWNVGGRTTNRRTSGLHPIFDLTIKHLKFSF